MKILAAVVCAVVFVAAFRRPLKRIPLLFYAGAGLLDIALLYSYSYAMPAVVWEYLLVFVQKCMFAQAILMIVMFTGVLKDGSRLKRSLLPIRGELSVFAAILVLGHAVPHLPFLSRVLGHMSAVPPNRAVSFLIAAALLVLLAVLTVTSFHVVRKRMDPGRWKRLQRLAYPFFLLTYVHLLLVLLDPALAGSGTAIVSIATYTVLFSAYVLLRLMRAAADRTIVRITGSPA